MLSLSYLLYLTVAAAGAGFIATFIINVVNDYLLKKRLSVIHPDTMISVDVFKIMHPIDSMKIGMYSLFLGGWFGTLAFMLLWLTPFYQMLVNSNIWVAAALYAFGVYIFMMLAFLPVVRRGFFGVLYHPKVPYWSFALLVLYAVLLALLVPIVL
jgi:hypothetical protein